MKAELHLSNFTVGAMGPHPSWTYSGTWAGVPLASTSEPSWALGGTFSNYPVLGFDSG